MDIQIILLVILAVLAISLASVCIYVLIILKEVRQTLTIVRKATEKAISPMNVLKNLGNVVETVAGAINSARAVSSIADMDEEDNSVKKSVKKKTPKKS